MSIESPTYTNEILKRVPVPAATIWLAQTSQGIKFLNHQPRDVSQYIAGPFDSRQTAHEWLLIRRQRRINRLNVITLTVCVLAVLVAMAA